jgi:hypothetical protein
MSSENSSFALASRQTWRELCRVALFETDKQKRPSRIDEAERALLLRARELSVISSENNQEAQDLEYALYAVRRLRNCLKPNTSESEAA